MLEIAEFWLLDVAVRGMPGIRHVIGPPEELTARWNAVAHRYSKEVILDTLLRMGRKDWIYFVDTAAPQRIDVRNREQLWNAHRAIHYGLTDSGASLWEEHAAPDWERFYEDSYMDEQRPEDEVLILTAASESRLRDVFEHFSYAVFNIRENYSQLERTALSPWNATYWKVLPAGVRLTCEIAPESWTPQEEADVRAYLTGPGRSLKRWRKYGISLNESECLYPGLESVASE